MTTEKPPYRVPTMAEISALPPNGFDAVSTFSGCGGSSLGYRMAGFRVLWANEFVEAARDTYRANAAPCTVLDGRDVRDVTGAEILAAIGKTRGELDLFDGSPPCASFSTAGKREKGWGKVKTYSDTEQRADDLFFEFARLVDEVQPRVFVAENVSGLVKGTAKGYFKLILARLRAAGYRVSARVLDASWLGVPQARQRLIFVGVREDLGVDPVHPRPLPYQYTVRDTLPWITDQGVIHDTSGNDPAVDCTDRPIRTITTGHGNSGHYQIHGRGPDLLIRDVTNAGVARMEARSVDEPIPTITAGGIGSANSTQVSVGWPAGPRYDTDGVPHDPETGQRIALVGVLAREWERTRQGQNSDRYYSLARNHPDEPSQTVTARGGAGAAAVTHATERRKFTLGELRAVGGFPPDFVLTGTYQQRWERIGRAVPPVMMSHIAVAIRDEVLTPLRASGAI